MDRARPALVVGLLLVLAAGLLWLFFSRVDPTSEAASPPSSPPAEVAEALGTTLEVESAPRAPAPAEMERDAVDAAPVVASVEPAVASSESLELHGRLILVEADGSERTDVDGELTILAWDEEMGVHHDTPVEAGRWRITLAKRAAIVAVEFGEARVEGRVVKIEDPLGRLPPNPVGEVLVHVSMPHPAILRVVAAESGADLSGVMLLKRWGSRGEHPGPDPRPDETLLGLNSPIDVSAYSTKLEAFGSARLLVGAAGRVWTPVELDLRAGGERVVSLARGGGLLIRVRGVDRSSGAELRLRGAGGVEPIAAVALRSDRDIELSGLLPGELSVSGEIGDWFDSPLVLGAAKAEVVVGALTEVDLTLEPPPRAEVAPIAGVAYIAEEWPKPPKSLFLDLLDTPLERFDPRHSLVLSAQNSDRAGYRAFRWSLDAAQVGRYELGMYDPPYSIAFELPRGGRTDFEFVLGPPVELYVRVLDDVSGEPAVVDELNWNPHRPVGVSGGSLESAKHAPDGVGFLVNAPLGEVDLMLWSQDYQPYNETVDTSHGVREHTIRLARACGVLLSFVDDETPVSIPEDWYGNLTRIDGEGRQSLTHSGRFERKMMVTEPGLYSLEPPKFAGYLQPPEQRIEIVAGQFTKHAVKLEREHP